MVQEETISAIATAVGEGGIGIIRMSGQEAIAIADKLFCGFNGRRADDIASHSAAYGRIVDPVTKATIDEVLLILMRSPRSYTREDVAEIHCHGGPVPLRRILELTFQSGARPAEPGEFTKRAFLNGRLDLAQAEAVIDIIRAKTDASLKMAVNHLSGQLSAVVGQMRDDVLAMIAQLEAAIDFPEEDIEELAAEEVDKRITEALAKLNDLLATAQTGRILRDGLQTVIIGKPNVGKSSLLNALLREKRAIVTDIPGTTRDVIEEYVNIRGIPLRIVDTAGIRETTDLVEQIGVQRAKEFLQKADLVLLLLDASLPLSREDRQIIDLLADQPVLVLVNKSDLPVRLDLQELAELLPEQQMLRISVEQGSGLQELEQAITDRVYRGEVSASEGALVANARHVHLLEQTVGRLQAASQTIADAMPPDCIVIDLRAAWEILGEITGQTVGEDLLDQIFSRFCIGK